MSYNDKSNFESQYDEDGFLQSGSDDDEMDEDSPPGVPSPPLPVPGDDRLFLGAP